MMLTDWHCFSKEVVAQIAANKVVADLRRNALHVVRQVAESGSGTSSNSAPLICHAVRATAMVLGSMPIVDAAHAQQSSAPCKKKYMFMHVRFRKYANFLALLLYFLFSTQHHMIVTSSGPVYFGKRRS